MKRLLAVTIALVLITAPLALAGPRGGGGGRSSFGSGKMQKSFQQPTQPQTGTVKDLGLNPSSKSPIDSVKQPSTVPPTAASPAPGGVGPATPAPAPTAGFFGGGGFGSGWMNWAIIGYLFGRTTSRPDEAKIKEKEKEKEQAKSKEQVAAKEQTTDSSRSITKEEPKGDNPVPQTKSPLDLK
jgi:hypothetical protein